MRYSTTMLIALAFSAASPAFACRSVQSQSYMLTEAPAADVPRGTIMYRVKLDSPDTAFDAMVRGKGTIATIIKPGRLARGRGTKVRLLLPAWHSCAQIGPSIGYVVGKPLPRGKTRILTIEPVLRRIESDL
jgi:hypothetical protein